MTQRVKELIKEEIEYWLDYDTYEFSISTIKSDIQNTLNNILQAHKNEIAEKDRKIDLLLTANKQITYSTKSREYNQPKLYKEDFIIGCLYCIQQDKHDKCLPVRYFLKKDSEQKYDKLLSKDVK